MYTRSREKTCRIGRRIPTTYSTNQHETGRDF